MRIELCTTGVKVPIDDLDFAIELMLHANMKGYPSVIIMKK